MDQDIRQKIFQSFFSTKGSQGTGIGLMMTQKIVDLHGGQIQVSSEKGAGASFIVRLPEKPSKSN
jgi:signal transduction histidine kinase